MVESFPFMLLLGTMLGFLAGIGVGGGSLLILWLTLVMKIPAETARIMNLLFFIPCALISSLFRRKQGVLELRTILPGIIAGCIAAALFSWLGIGMNTALLKKLFGSLLVFTGIRELYYKQEKAP